MRGTEKWRKGNDPRKMKETFQEKKVLTKRTDQSQAEKTFNYPILDTSLWNYRKLMLKRGSENLLEHKNNLLSKEERNRI